MGGPTVHEPPSDPIAEFYDRHPYPPPVENLDRLAERAAAGHIDLAAHHLIWPRRRPEAITAILVAGCGTSQAVRHAIRHPHAQVVGIDVSGASVEHTRRLARRHGLGNLTVHRHAIEDVADLGRRFDHIVCTGVVHHLAEPAAGLVALRQVLTPGGAITLMVYGRYGRTGVHLMQEYCRMLGVGTSESEIADLVAALRELPAGHPLARLLRDARDFRDNDALADALLNPRDRSYTVPELLDLLGAAGLRFGRWVRQAPYLPSCGSISETPHALRIGALPVERQYAALELYRGTIDRHTLIAFDARDDCADRLTFADDGAGRWVPLPVSTTATVEDPDRLPAGAAAAVLNRAHPATDLVMFVDERALETIRRIDGRRTIDELGPGARSLVERMWRHDLVVIDATLEGAA